MSEMAQKPPTTSTTFISPPTVADTQPGTKSTTSDQKRAATKPSAWQVQDSGLRRRPDGFTVRSSRRCWFKLLLAVKQNSRSDGWHLLATESRCQYYCGRSADGVPVPDNDVTMGRKRADWYAGRAPPWPASTDEGAVERHRQHKRFC